MKAKFDAHNEKYQHFPVCEYCHYHNSVPSLTWSRTFPGKNICNACRAYERLQKGDLKKDTRKTFRNRQKFPLQRDSRSRSRSSDRSSDFEIENEITKIEETESKPALRRSSRSAVVSQRLRKENTSLREPLKTEKIKSEKPLRRSSRSSMVSKRLKKENEGLYKGKPLIDLTKPTPPIYFVCDSDSDIEVESEEEFPNYVIVSKRFLNHKEASSWEYFCSFIDCDEEKWMANVSDYALRQFKDKARQKVMLL